MKLGLSHMYAYTLCMENIQHLTMLKYKMHVEEFMCLLYMSMAKYHLCEFITFTEKNAQFG